MARKRRTRSTQTPQAPPEAPVVVEVPPPPEPPPQVVNVPPPDLGPLPLTPGGRPMMDIDAICDRCGVGYMEERYSGRNDSWFLGCSEYPVCYRTAPHPYWRREDETNARVAQLLDEQRKVLTLYGKAKSELREAEDAIRHLEEDAEWMLSGLLRLAARFHPALWEYEYLAVDLHAQLMAAFRCMYGDKHADRLQQDLAHAQADEENRQDCGNPACRGCAERRACWPQHSAPFLPCLEEGS